MFSQKNIKVSLVTGRVESETVMVSHQSHINTESKQGYRFAPVFAASPANSRRCMAPAACGSELELGWTKVLDPSPPDL
jgi:hypothetical protein